MNDSIINFFNSNFFTSLSTILTVAGAVLIFYIQKWKTKQQIAGLLVNEIRNAEEAIRQLKERTPDIDLPEIVILPQNNWNKYSHLFIKDFDEDQITSLNRFYADADRANYILKQGNSMELFLLEIRQKSNSIQNKIADIIEKTPEAQVGNKVNEFTSKLDKGLYHYAPVGFNTKLDKYLENIYFILETPAGMKLKKIAGLNK